ncbi:3'-5' exonuclease, partial [Acinetobacter calcoaceticus]
ARVFLKDINESEIADKNIFRLHINNLERNRYAKLDDFIQKIKDDNKFEFSDFVILAANNATVRHYAKNTSHNYKIYEDDPLDSMNHYIAQLCSDLLLYKYSKNYSSYSIYESYKTRFINFKLNNFKSEVKKIKVKNNTDEICEIIKNIILKTSYRGSYKNFILAIKSILNTPHLLKKYQPNNKNELQIMTIHKAKGLEFKVVIHIGLEEWVLPRRTVNNGQWRFQDFEGDKNLHYVAITRAEKICYLVDMSVRVNAHFREIDANKSEFLCIRNLDKYIVDLGSL